MTRQEANEIAEKLAEQLFLSLLRYGWSTEPVKLWLDLSPTDQLRFREIIWELADGACTEWSLLDNFLLGTCD